MEPQLATALARLTTGMYVLTARVGNCAHGMSASWVTQVSGTPVLLMAAVEQHRHTHQMILDSAAFALNIIGTHSKYLAEYFASPQAQRPHNLTPFALEISKTGAPCLRDALAALACRLVSTHTAGDHTLFVGEVCDVWVGEADSALTSQEASAVYLGSAGLFTQARQRPTPRRRL